MNNCEEMGRETRITYKYLDDQAGLEEDKAIIIPSPALSTISLKKHSTWNMIFGQEVNENAYSRTIF